MKKTYLVIICLLIFASAVALVGFSTFSNPDQIDVGMRLIESVSINQVKYVDIISSKDEVFAGQYKYSDGEYYYIYNSNGCYISLIIPVIDITPTGEGVISTIAAQNIAIKYFNTYNTAKITGEIISKGSEIEGIGYVYEVIEKIGELETGTKASVVINNEGKLLSASFIQGDSSLVSKYSSTDTITENQAYDIALKAVIDFRQKNDIIDVTEESIKEASYSAQLKTFKDKMYWNVSMPVKLDSNSDVRNYYVQVDVFSGSVLEIAYDLN